MFRGDPLVPIRFLGRASVYFVPKHFQLYWNEELATRWTEDAFSGGRFERGPVGCTKYVPAVIRHKLNLDPIHRHGHVRTAINIREVFAFVINEETLGFKVIHEDQKFLGGSRLEFIDFGHT